MWVVSRDADVMIAGVMAARGLLANPAMFTGAHCTTLECLQDWVGTPVMPAY